MTHQTYQQVGDGAAPIYIDVNTWRKKSISLPELSWWASGNIPDFFDDCNDCRPFPVVLPALKNTFNLLENYDPGGWKYYEPEKLAVWVYRLVNSLESKPWPLGSVSLEELAEMSGERYASVIISGEIVGDWFGNVLNGKYLQDGRGYEIYARPLWPYEETVSYKASYDVPSSELPETISCHVSDGVLPIPTPAPLP
jgi:hypothetical protein